VNLNDTPAEIWRYETGPDDVALPVAELHGNEPGPTWLLTGGVHGDEYEGPEAIRRLVATMQHGQFPGKIIALPVTNPLAYAAGTRLTPADGGNLNRSFPGSATGTFTERWADWLWQNSMLSADRLIDLHAGGVTWQFEPIAGFYRDEDIPFAATFNIRLWQMPDTPGVLSREFRAARGPAVGVELGHGGVRHEGFVLKALAGLTTLVRGKTLSPSKPIYTHTDVVAGQTGEWNYRSYLRQTVPAGYLLGFITDWAGNVIEEIRSPFAARVLAVRRLVSVRAGELVVVLGTVRD
jgi:hypothetical protein